MKLIIDRKTWLRGEGWENSRLLRKSDGKMCCLGVLALACQLPSEAIEGSESPNDCGLVHRSLMPSFLFKNTSKLNYSVSNTCVKLMRINDDKECNDEEREADLTATFAANGIEVEFIN